MKLVLDFLIFVLELVMLVCAIAFVLFCSGGSALLLLLLVIL